MRRQRAVTRRGRGRRGPAQSAGERLAEPACSPGQKNFVVQAFISVQVGMPAGMSEMFSVRSSWKVLAATIVKFDWSVTL